jgi:hypothetical protein
VHPEAAPVLVGVRLRAGKAGSSRGATSMVVEAINTAIEAGARAASILVRGDSAYCAGKIIAAVVKAATFSFAIARNAAVDAAIATIPDEAYKPVQYPGAVVDPNTGQLISNAQVAEVLFTAFAETPHEIAARLVVRRVLDANTQDPLFPVWRYHPFFTNSTEPERVDDVTPQACLDLANAQRNRAPLTTIVHIRAWISICPATTQTWSSRSTHRYDDNGSSAV